LVCFLFSPTSRRIKNPTSRNRALVYASRLLSMSIRRDANKMRFLPRSLRFPPGCGELSGKPWGRTGTQARGSEGQRERMQADTGAEVGGEGHSQSLTARASIDRQYWRSGLEEIPNAPQSNNGGSYIGCLGFCHGATSSRYRSTLPALPACLLWENREITGPFLAGGGDSCRSWGAYVKPMYIQYGVV
jgi:hypothetical protein